MHYLQQLPWTPDAHHNSFASYSAQLKVAKGCTRAWISTISLTTTTNTTLLASGKVTNCSHHAFLYFLQAFSDLTCTNTCYKNADDFVRPLPQQGEEAKSQHLIRAVASLLLSGAASQPFTGVSQWDRWLFFQVCCNYMGFSLSSTHLKSCYSWVLQQVKIAQLPEAQGTSFET